MGSQIVEDPQAEWKPGGSDEGLAKLYGPETMQRALCVDFDGCLHAYRNGWQGHDTVADEPEPGARTAMLALAEAGWRLYVLTSRAELGVVVEWLDRHDFPDMLVTRIKPIAVAYIDDRAVRYEGCWPSVRKMFA